MADIQAQATSFGRDMTSKGASSREPSTGSSITIASTAATDNGYKHAFEGDSFSRQVSVRSEGPLRVAVIGQDVFGAACYHEIKKRGYNIVGVFTIPDVITEGVAGVKQDPLALAAQADGKPVFKFKRWQALKKEGGAMLPEIFTQYKSVGAELNVLAFCSQFIPMEVNTAPRYGAIVYHPSILPKHRGASAINWTLMDGDEKGGFTIFYADDGLDTGDIILTKETYLDPEETLSGFYDRFCFPEGVTAMGDVVDMIQKGIAPRISQENLPGATYDPIWKKKDLAQIDFSMPGRKLHNFIRGNDRVPGAWATLTLDGADEVVSFFGSQYLGSMEDVWDATKHGRQVSVVGAAGKPGPSQPILVGCDGLYIRCSDGTGVRVTTVARSSENGVVKPASALFEKPVVAPTFDPSELSNEESAMVERVAKVWWGILALEPGTPLDTLDFFGAGGGSAAVAALCARSMAEAGVQISPDKVYGHSGWPQFVGLCVTTHRAAAGAASGCADIVFPEGGLHDLGVLPNGTKATVPRVPFINGEFIMPVEGTSSKTFSPHDGKLICDVAEGTGPEVQQAVVAAHKAFQPNSAWRKLSGRERGKLLYKLADIMEEHKQELASIEALDSGAVVTLAVKVHIGMSIDAFRYYAGWCDKIQGETIPINDSRPSKNLCITKKEPVGVCALIVPWNYPLMMLAWKMAACLCAGNTVVLKPARVTPLTALKFAELSAKAGFPPGVINILPGSGAKIGEMLGLHPMVRKIGFTGSTPVGKQIMQYCAQSNLKKCSLELGGKSPLLIFDDCDMEKAVKNAVQACIFNKGENCIAAGRIFVQDTIYDAFIAGVIVELKKLNIGCPFDGNTNHGPQNHEAHFKSLLEYVEKGQEEGAKLVHGGKRVGEKGFFMEPAVLKDVEDHMWVAKEESFGPIMVLSVFDGDIEKVVRRANAVEFGLACGVFTKDLSRALRVSDLLEGGTCFVNVWNKTDVAAPFGGFKQSGFGKDLGEEALKEYLKTKTVTIEY